IQADARFYSMLQDAKAQLDLPITLLWLTAVSAFIWLAALTLTGRAFLPFIAVWLAGPALVYVWYVTALQNYRAFADLLRSAVDLYRWDLLAALHLPHPAGAEEEREVWATLLQRTAFGEDVNISYVRLGK